MVDEHMHREAALVSCDLVGMAFARQNSDTSTFRRHGGHFAHRQLVIVLKALPLRKRLTSLVSQKTLPKEST